MRALLALIASLGLAGCTFVFSQENARPSSSSSTGTGSTSASSAGSTSASTSTASSGGSGGSTSGSGSAGSGGSSGTGSTSGSQTGSTGGASTGTSPCTWTPVGGPSPVGFGAPVLVAAGDFNGDGFDDLAMASANSDAGILLFLAVDGGFRNAPRLPQPSNIAFILAGDLTDGGFDDLVVGSDGTPAGVGLLISDGGAFPTTLPTFVGSSGEEIISGALGRFGPNGSGPLEAAVVNSDGTSSILRYQESPNALVAQVQPGPFIGPSSGLAIADLDGDGSADLVVASGANQTLSCALSASGFSPGCSDVQGPTPDTVAAGHLSSASSWDVVAASQQGDGGVDRYAWIAGDIKPAGTLGGQTFGPVYALLLRDLDRDGLDDVIIGHQDGVAVYWSSTHTFSEVLTGEPVNSLAVGDFNRDGVLDVAAGLLNVPSVQIIEGHCSP